MHIWMIASLSSNILKARNRLGRSQHGHVKGDLCGFGVISSPGLGGGGGAPSLFVDHDTLNAYFFTDLSLQKGLSGIIIR